MMEQVSKMANEAIELPGPTPEMLALPQFEAVWQAIKRWDIERKPGDGYAGANGSDVRAILDALDFGCGPETAAMAANFAKVLGEMMKADPERRFDITPSVAADALYAHASGAQVALLTDGDGPELRGECAEVLMALGCLLAGLTEARK